MAADEKLPSAENVVFLVVVGPKESTFSFKPSK
jgi:hypothetical protein